MGHSLTLAVCSIVALIGSGSFAFLIRLQQHANIRAKIQIIGERAIKTKIENSKILNNTSEIKYNSRIEC